MHEDVLRKLRESGDLVARQQVINEALKSNKDFILCDVSLAGCDLSGLDFIGVPMNRIDLRGATCCDAQFFHLTDCVLDNVDASRSHFSRIERCRFRQTNLIKSYIGGRFSGCDFSGSILRFSQIGPVLSEHKGDYGNNCFDGADLHGIDAAAGYLANTSFRNVQLTGARLSRSNLSGCDLQQANLTGANITRACLAGAVTTDAIFDECVMAVDQAEELRSAHPHHTHRFKIFSYAPGPKTTTLTKELEKIQEYRFDWHFYFKNTPQAEKIMITNKGSDNKLWGYAFQSDTRNFIRMYPMDEGSNEFSSILLNIATDYADWQIDPQSIKVEISPPTTAIRINQLFRGMLDELFHMA